MYVYIESQHGLWTVGFYKPSGDWEPESDHNTSGKAAARVAWLNGSKSLEEYAEKITPHYDAKSQREV